MRKTYYQPERNGNLPEELWEFQVFKDYETAFNWLVQHDYDTDEWEIKEYHDEGERVEAAFINEYGDDEEE